MTKELVHLVLKIYPLCQCRAFLSHHLLKVSSLLKKLVSCKKRVICAMLQSSQEIHNTDVDYVKILSATSFAVYRIQRQITRCTGYTSLVIGYVSRFKVDLIALTVKRKFLVKETWMITSVRTMNTNIFVFYTVK